MNLLAGGTHEVMCARRPRRRCCALRDMERRIVHSEMTAFSLAARMLMVISEESRYSPSHTTSTVGGHALLGGEGDVQLCADADKGVKPPTHVEVCGLVIAEITRTQAAPAVWHLKGRATST